MRTSNYTTSAGAKRRACQRKADLAQLLVANDLRRLQPRHNRSPPRPPDARANLNPNPQLQVVKETPCSVLVDGDGGLGYFPAHEGTLRAIDKAKANGMAAMTSRNHGHFGAAGLYSRLAIGHDLIAYVTSGHQLHLQPGQPLYDAGGGSPMSFLAPTDQEDPLVLDFGALHDLCSHEKRDQIPRCRPGAALYRHGVCQAWACSA